eukprot:scaffold137776_cov28-Tisochrysis_lutea.AAC.4
MFDIAHLGNQNEANPPRDRQRLVVNLPQEANRIALIRIESFADVLKVGPSVVEAGWTCLPGRLVLSNKAVAQRQALGWTIGGPEEALERRERPSPDARGNLGATPQGGDGNIDCRILPVQRAPSVFLSVLLGSGKQAGALVHRQQATQQPWR